MNDRDKTDCIIARAPCCNRLIFATVNEGRKLDLKAKRKIADMAIEGYTIEHMTVTEVRKADWGCECKKDIKVCHYCRNLLIKSEGIHFDGREEKET